MTVDTEVINGSDVRVATVSGLNSTTRYTVSVAAVNGAGTGPATTSINFAIGGENFSPQKNTLGLCAFLWYTFSTIYFTNCTERPSQHTCLIGI